MRHHRLYSLILALVLPLLLGACSAASAGAFAEGMAQGMAAASSPGFGTSSNLQIFGGPNHDTYLGCLTCSEYNSDSVFNSYGSYGSSYSSQSIHNSYSQFGSPYSQYSACNSMASDPPVVVSETGDYYGRLTLTL